MYDCYIILVNVVLKFDIELEVELQQNPSLIN